MKKGYLVLSNGMVFEGTRFGAEGSSIGELVFNTGMTGYIETLTDPSYYGQIIMFTFPLVGNYGIMEEDFEGAGNAAKGCVLRQWCETPSNFRCEYDLDTFLKKKGIPGICGIDTRRITRIIREYGVMNARISRSPELTAQERQELEDYRVRNAVMSVSGQKRTLTGDRTDYRVVLWDFGAKENIARELVKRGCEVTVVPGSTTAEEILAMNPDGIMLSNGPGDPAENVGIIAQLRKVSESGIPIFGICLGHQLMALARGGKTMKLKYGHRGANQPVKNLQNDRIFVSSQNHGYAVDTNALPSGGVMSYENANDGTCEGIRYLDIPAFTVQFHPEACGGPHDTNFLFDEFIQLIENNK